MPQMKEQGKSPEKGLNEVEASKLPDTEFKQWLGRLRDLSENFNNIKNTPKKKHTIETIRKHQSEMKKTLEK